MFRSVKSTLWVLIAAVQLAVLAGTRADEPAGVSKNVAAEKVTEKATPEATEKAAAKTAAPQKPEHSVASDDDISSDLGRLHGEKPRYPRVLFITAKDSPRCGEELTRLRRTGGDFESMQTAGWQIGEGADSDIQIVDREQVPELVQKLKPKEYPAVACISHKKIVRSFKSGCTTPLDAWTFSWLAKGIDERPTAPVLEAAQVESTGHYPLRGNHWSVSGDWNPTREAVLQHLRGPNHVNQLQADWHIDDWSYEELRSLHDNLHESEPGWQYSGSGNSSNEQQGHKSKGER